MLSKKYKIPLIALILGCLLPLAFAPFDYWWLSLLLMTALMWLLQGQQSAKQNFITAYSFGVGYFGVGISWVYFSLHDFGNASPLVSGLITVLLIAWQSLYLGLFGFLYGKIKALFKPKFVSYLIPLTWFSIEWIKGILFTGFPWLSLGYSHLESPISAWIPWIGVYGVGAISILLSMGILHMINRDNNDHRILISVCLLFVAFSPALDKIEQTNPQAKTLTITQVQGNIPQKMKWQPSKRQEIFNIYWESTKIHWDSDLIVWPETAVPGKSELIAESLIFPMSMIATEKSSNILFGVLASNLAKKEYRNSMIMVGENQGQYDKRHLVPFGEYMPLRFVLNFLNQFIRIPMSDMQVGADKQPMMQIDEVKLGVSICYEDVFSRDIIQDLPEANILINTSNDAWFGNSLAPHQHLQIAQMRAKETQRPMVRNTNTGISAFIDHHGNITQRTEQFVQATITEKVTGRTGSTLFVFLQPFQWVLVLFTVLMLANGFRKRLGIGEVTK